MTIPPTTAHEDPADQAAAAAYMAMLRRIHEVSGLTAGQIAAFSGLPRSTAYRFIDRRNTTLPKNRDQVEAFLKACRCSRASITRMLALWDEVSGNAPQQDAPADGRVLLDLRIEDDDEDTPPPKDEDEDDTWEWPESAPQDEATSPLLQVPPPPEPYETPRVTTYRLGYRDYAERAHADVCLRCLEYAQQQREHQKKLSLQSSAQTGRGGVMALLLPLTMLAFTLYPLAVAFWLSDKFPGGGFTSGATAFISLALLVVAAGVHRPGQRTSVLTPTRLAAAAFGGICAGLLAWAAVPVVPIAVLTGFAVFTMAPLWFSLTKLTSIATTPQGMFGLIAALWCGISLGAAVAHIGFPIFGSILVGALVTATAVALLCSNAPGDEQQAQSRRAAVQKHLHARAVRQLLTRSVV
ncbi:hypothetical protein [Nocardia neocaledoniensis]|uniref:hypothetical protein n=1 Tax=Nocardia neocaledoniensis TaxID=236511 RepID=UPI002457109F|nr:hypothetical protein [Nocardia neocaledoniensis]